MKSSGLKKEKKETCTHLFYSLDALQNGVVLLNFRVLIFVLIRFKGASMSFTFLIIICFAQRFKKLSCARCILLRIYYITIFVLFPNYRDHHAHASRKRLTHVKTLYNFAVGLRKQNTFSYIMIIIYKHKCPCARENYKWTNQSMSIYKFAGHGDGFDDVE